ncbi:MAG: alanine--tRNA ligase [Myxococcota bacterium]|nr:alanine--tRNA ligase [Myxococcota bacterium]
MDAHELRRQFLNFFQSLEHELVPSSPVVPKQDPTLLFANAGMNQFKDVFLGNEVRPYKRAASVQKCIRAGGKHNDLDEVGKDDYHLTFFEMLGNWSFGDYYKRESIKWGWDFLTRVLELPVERLYVTVYKDDDESYAIWRDEVGVAEPHITRLGDIEKGDEENFWSMGPVGPCGPCTEIHYDRRPHEGDGWPADPKDRFLEIWNHVFMEFDRDEQGKLTPLPMKSVDTGMGLDRVASVLAGVEGVYASSLFKQILERIAELAGRQASQAELLAGEDVVAYRVIADHVRTLTFAVSEGQPFSNEGRGYVLRRILRRAVRYGRKLGLREPFLYKVSQAVVEDFGDAYPEIRVVAAQTQEVIHIEEERFFRTLERGMSRFDELVAKLGEHKELSGTAQAPNRQELGETGQAPNRQELGETGQASNRREIPGSDAFVLYDTFGFPLDLTEIMAAERGLSVDRAGFERALDEQRARSAESARFYDGEAGPWLPVREGNANTFLGYSRYATASQIVRYRPRGEHFELLLDITPFYAEAGGEVGDSGSIRSEDGCIRFSVLDTQHSETGIVHVCRLEEGFVTDESMRKDMIAEVDLERRMRIAANHTATHLLHAALHAIVSKEAHQAGSLVTAEKLRFDFTYPRSLSREQLEAIEDMVNGHIRSAREVIKHSDVPIDTAREWGAMAIFGEKYGEKVRVIQVPDVSIELCGGVHADNTRELQYFRILQEGAIAAGTRRIEAVTRDAAFAVCKTERETLQAAVRAANVDQPALLVPRIMKLQAEHKASEDYAEQLLRRVAKAELVELIKGARELGGVRVFSARLELRERRELLMYADLLRDLFRGVALLGAVLGEKPALVCVVSEELATDKRFQATPLVNACAAHIGGKGGGRPTLAQAGGHDSERLDEALQAIFAELEQRIQQ